MKKSCFYRIICLLLFIGSNYSCTSDLDFNQVEDLVLEPVYEANLSYFEAPATAFVASDGTEYQWAYDDQNFDVFRDKYLNSYLIRTDFYFEITNTINRAYTLDIILYDANNNALNTMHFDIPAYTGTAYTLKQTEIFQNTRLDLLKRARKMRFLAAMMPGPALSKSSTGSIELRSSATVYLKMR